MCRFLRCVVWLLLCRLRTDPLKICIQICIPSPQNIEISISKICIQYQKSGSHLPNIEIWFQSASIISKICISYQKICILYQKICILYQKSGSQPPQHRVPAPIQPPTVPADAPIEPGIEPRGDAFRLVRVAWLAFIIVFFFFFFGMGLRTRI
jgi:hypothetical protein